VPPWKSSPVASPGEHCDPVADEARRTDDEIRAPDREEAEPPLLSKEEAIAEVKRWIERHKIDPDRIFARTGELVVRYGELIPHLEQETDEGRLILRAISRGRVIRQQHGVSGGGDGPQQ